MMGPSRTGGRSRRERSNDFAARSLAPNLLDRERWFSIVKAVTVASDTCMKGVETYGNMRD
jgi:hypothetical protein